MSRILLGIDIGTSACKAAAFDVEGRVIAQATQSYNVYYPEPGFVEQNPMEWWSAVIAAIRGILDTGKVRPEKIAGIGVDGQSWSAIPVDREGNVLYNTPIWMDTRSRDICNELTQKIGFERIFSISGNALEPTYSTPKILWFKRHKPDVYNKTYKFLQSNSFITYKLTGVMAQDKSQSYGLHMFNVKSGQYDCALSDEFGIPVEKLPDIYACHEIIGEVTPEAAQETGLVPGTPVVAGGLDAACGTLGVGVIEKGQTQEQGGQAGGMSICVNDAIAHPKLILSYHVVPDVWLLQGGTVGGGSLKWFYEQLGAHEEYQAKLTGKRAFQIMDEEAQEIPCGSEGLIFLPYMAGERSPIWDGKAKGVFFGLDYSKTRAHMIRAVMEGCAFALYHNIKTAEEAKVSADVLNAMGGAANSRLWTQIKADVTGRVIHVPASDTATTLGAAILAGVGTGLYSSFRDAAARTVTVMRTHEPDMNAHKQYVKHYDTYLEIYEKLKDTMHNA